MSVSIFPSALLADLGPVADDAEVTKQRELYELSLYEFVRAAWPSIDSAEFSDCWAIRALCLPYGAMIITDDGLKRIGEIVETKWDGLVLSFNHQAQRHEWK